MDSPFFIVGSGRSGSTLLRMILSAHSRICIPPETHYILSLSKKLPSHGRLSDIQIEQAVEIILSSYRWPDFKMEASTFRKKAKNLNDPELKDILNIVYNEKMDLEDKKRWGDKTPPYINILPYIHELYPSAKFINLIRDGRDVTESFRRTGWYGRWLHNSTMEWKQSVLAYNNYKNTVLSDLILNIRYEDLVLDTKETTKKIIEFLGEDFESTMLNWGDDIANKIPDREAHIHKKLNRKPKAKDIERWKNELSPMKVLIIESFISRELTQSGYQLYFNHFIFKIIHPVIRNYLNLTTPALDFLTRALRYILNRI